MIKFIFIIILSITFFSCESKNVIIITKDYIIRKTSEQKRGYGFDIEKIKALDSLVPPRNYEIEKRTHSFCSSGREQKIYFNKISDSVKWSFPNNITRYKQIYGELDIRSWYHFKRLDGVWEHFIYIDSLGLVEQYAEISTNY